MRLTWILASTVVLIAGVWWARRSPGEADRRPPAALVPSSGQVELALLRQEVQAVRAEAAEARRLVEKAGAHQGTRQEPGGSPVSAPSSQADEDHSFDEYVAALGEHFAAEAVDATWTAGADFAVKLAAVLPPSSRVRSLECRSTMCRLETAHADARQYQAFSSRFLLQANASPIWMGPAVFQVTHAPEREGDALVAVAFLARESFPPPDSNNASLEQENSQ